MGKNSAVIYHSYLDRFSRLSDEQFGRLMRIALHYDVDGIAPKIDDEKVADAFAFMQFDIDENRKRYQLKAEINLINGRRGGRPQTKTQKTQSVKNNPKNPTEPKKPDKESESDKDMMCSLSILDRTILDFVEFRKKIRKPMTERAVDLLKKKLDEIAKTDDEKIAVLNQSIVNGWQGVFELKQTEKGRASPQTDDEALRKKGYTKESLELYGNWGPKK